jgi:hypothetical protein
VRAFAVTSGARRVPEEGRGRLIRGSWARGRGVIRRMTM